MFNRSLFLNAFPFFLASFFSLAVFVKGVSPSVYAGDSGDIILASWYGGVAHPPGYPLNIMLGWLFTHFPYEASVAYKANLLAAFIQAGVIGVFYLIIKKLTNNIFVSLASSFVLAFNPLFWLYAHIIEVFQLNLLLVACSVYFLILWRESCLAKKEKIKYLYFSILFWGFSVFHHHTSILLFPAYLYLIFVTKKLVLRDKKQLIKLSALFLLGVVPYVFTVFAAFRETPANWGDPKTLPNFLRLITRADYGTFVAGALFVGGELKTRIIAIVNFFLFLKADFSIVGLILIVFGGAHLFFKKNTIFWFLTLSLFFTGPFFIFYSNFPSSSDSFFAGLWERFILITYPFFALLIGIGMLFVYNLFVSSFSKRFSYKNIDRNFYKFVVGLFLFILPIWMFSSNFEKANLKNFFLGDWVAHDILASAEPDAIVFLFGDTTVFNTEYYYHTSGLFEDRVVIRPSSLYRPDYRQLLVRQYPHLDFPDNFASKNKDVTEVSKILKELIDKNLNKHPIYFSEGLPPVFNYKVASVGLIKKLVSEEEYKQLDLVKINEERFLNFAFKEVKITGYEHFLIGHIKVLYYASYMDVAEDLYHKGEIDEAKKYLHLASELISDRKESYSRLAAILIEEEKCDLARENLEKAYSLDGKDVKILMQFSSLYRECFHDLDKANEFEKRAKYLFDSSKGQELNKF